MQKIDRDFECKVEYVYNEELSAPEMKISIPDEFKRIMDLYVVRADTMNYERPVLDQHGDIKKVIRKRYLIKGRLKSTFKSLSSAEFWAGVLYDQEEFDALHRTVPVEDISSFHSMATQLTQIIGKITSRAVEDTMHFSVTIKEDKE